MNVTLPEASLTPHSTSAHSAGLHKVWTVQMVRWGQLCAFTCSHMPSGLLETVWTRSSCFPTAPGQGGPCWLQRMACRDTMSHSSVRTVLQSPWIRYVSLLSNGKMPALALVRMYEVGIHVLWTGHQTFRDMLYCVPATFRCNQAAMPMRSSLTCGQNATAEATDACSNMQSSQ